MSISKTRTESREVDKPLIIYGTGKLGKLANDIFSELHIPTYTMADNRTSPNVLKRVGLKKDCLVAIAIATVSEAEIRIELKPYGFRDVRPVWDILEYYSSTTGIHNGWFAGELTQEDKNGIAYVRSTFADELSVLQYDDFCAWRDRRKPYTYAVDLGYDAALPSSLQDIRNRQGVSTYADPLPRELRIHCEGYELSTLFENLVRIKEQRPALSIACYHSRESLWQIQRACMYLLDDYSFSFRLLAFQGQAAYLHCTPNK